MRYTQTHLVPLYTAMLKKLHNPIVETLIILGGMFALLVVTNPFQSYVLFLIQSFAYQGMIFFCVVFLSTLFLRFRYAAIMSVVVITTTAFMITGSIQKPYEAVYSDGETLSILQINLAKDNAKIRDVLEIIEKESPDILSLQELSAVNYEIIERDLKEIFPYQYVKPDDASFVGLGIFSMLPILDYHVSYVHEYPIMHVMTEVKNMPVNIFALHTHAPYSRDMWAYQSDMFRELDSLIKESVGEVIVVGDLNAVPWHKEVSTVLQNNGLRVSAYQPLGTFPESNPIIRVPIDHILFSEGFQVLKTRVMSIPGSDHLGLSVDVQFL